MLRIFESAIAYVSPPLCMHCQHQWSADGVLCASCLLLLKASQAPLDVGGNGVRSLYLYTPVVRTLIAALKYGAMPKVAVYLVQNASCQLTGGTWEWVPVPLHAARFRERGYNQAEVIAQALNRVWGRKMEKRTLWRVRYRSSQTRLGREERQWNAAGQFKAKACEGKRFTVVDDVYTTGATTNACRKALEAAGATWTQVLTLAIEPKACNGMDDYSLDAEIETRSVWQG